MSDRTADGQIGAYAQKLSAFFLAARSVCSETQVQIIM